MPNYARNYGKSEERRVAVTPELLVWARKAAQQIGIIKKKLHTAGMIEFVMCAWCLPANQ